MKPQHQAEVKNPSMEYNLTKLEAQLNAYGEWRADRFDHKMQSDSEDRGHVEYEIGTWARGPLVFIESIDSDGETQRPTLSDGLVKQIVAAGYTPWGFRPERDTGGRRTHTGRWMWYLRPIADVADRHERADMLDAEWGIRNPDGTYVRNGDGAAVLFADARDAKAVADDEQDVRKVIQ